MLLPADYHMHTPLCRHARGEPVEYAARALELGLPEIGFSDHSPVEHDDQDDWRMLAGELSEYVAKVQLARDTHPALPIRLGLEVDSQRLQVNAHCTRIRAGETCDHMTA